MIKYEEIFDRNSCSHWNCIHLKTYYIDLYTYQDCLAIEMFVWQSLTMVIVRPNCSDNFQIPEHLSIGLLFLLRDFFNKHFAEVVGLESEVVRYFLLRINYYYKQPIFEFLSLLTLLRIKNMRILLRTWPSQTILQMFKEISRIVCI